MDHQHDTIKVNNSVSEAATSDKQLATTVVLMTPDDSTASILAGLSSKSSNNNNNNNNNNHNITASIISSGLGSESGLSVSNMSAFSSRAASSKSASTPIDHQSPGINGSFFVNRTADSAYVTTADQPSSMCHTEESLLGKSLYSSMGPDDSSSVTGSYIVKLIKPGENFIMSTGGKSHMSGSVQNVAAGSGSAMSVGSGPVKSKSMAKKCLEKTNRLIRSASTSSMNLISRMNPLGASSTNLSGGGGGEPISGEPSPRDCNDESSTDKESSMRHSSSMVFGERNNVSSDFVANKENAQPRIIKVIYFYF
jgi:hypothetical protein